MTAEKISRVGFVGLGIMGRPMALNLMKAGFSLVVHTRTRETAQAVLDQGATYADNPAAVAAASEMVIIMVPDSSDVELVAAGPNGVFAGAKRGLIVADMSTISPLVSQKVGKALGAKGVRMLDAPVSGGEKGAIDAALSIMVGGEKADFDAALPVPDQGAFAEHPDRRQVDSQVRPIDAEGDSRTPRRGRPVQEGHIGCFGPGGNHLRVQQQRLAGRGAEPEWPRRRWQRCRR
jgi:6-phosphogluconate dehydrogenase (decarboxylating)